MPATALITKSCVLAMGSPKMATRQMMTAKLKLCPTRVTLADEAVREARPPE